MPRIKAQPKDGLTGSNAIGARTDRDMELSRVPNPTRPEFAKVAARQARLLRGRPEEAEALTFIEAAFPWPEK